MAAASGYITINAQALYVKYGDVAGRASGAAPTWAQLTATAADAGIIADKNLMPNIAETSPAQQSSNNLEFSEWGKKQRVTIPAPASQGEFGFTVNARHNDAKHSALRGKGSGDDVSICVLYTTGTNAKTARFFHGQIGSVTPIDATESQPAQIQATVTIEEGPFWVDES